MSDTGYVHLKSIHYPFLLLPPLCMLRTLTDYNIDFRRKDLTDKAQEKITPESEKSVLDKAKEGVTDAGDKVASTVQPSKIAHTTPHEKSIS